MSGRHSRFPAVNRDVPPSGGDPVATAPPAPEPEPEPVPVPEPEAPPAEAPEAPTEETTPDGYPAEGSIPDVLEWVGDDPDRAAIALAAEQQREHPRKGILEALTG